MAKADLRDSQSHDIPQSREAYLESFERQWEQIHEGPMPERGLKEAGRHERKEVCEDVKLKNRERGLFLVADGISQANGWFASRETATIMYEALGEQLDQEIENIIKASVREGHSPEEMVTQYVKGKMIAALAEAEARIQQIGARNPEFDGSATTLSMVKLIDIPDGKGGSIQRMFFTNLGDSRIYLQPEGGGLIRVTQDDSYLREMVKAGRITEAEYAQMDQATDRRKLPDKLRRIALGPSWSIVTKQVGLGGSGETEVYFIDVRPGDRFMISSDGIGDQLPETRIAQILNSEATDTQKEKLLQGTAIDMSLRGADPRSKGDDIAALVQTIGERGPDRRYLQKETQEKQTTNSYQERIRILKHEIRSAHGRLEALLNKAASGEVELLRDRLTLKLETQQAEQELSLKAYQLERIRLDEMDKEIPPRLRTGDQVRIWRQDFDPPSFDRQPWSISGYNEDRKTYSLLRPGGQTYEMGRHVVERVQSSIKVRVGDRIPVDLGTGKPDRGFKVEGVDTQGNVTLVKEEEDVVARFVMNSQDAQQAIRQEIARGEQMKNQMDQHASRYHQALAQIEATQKEIETVKTVEAHGHAHTIASGARQPEKKDPAKEAERMHQIDSLKEKIQMYERILARFRVLEAKKASRQITSQEEKERMRLSPYVYETANSPSLETEIAHLRLQLSQLESE